MLASSVVKRRPPLLGFNHNVRHAGRLYHVQTEDSGAAKPHIVTHVFHSGTILATTRTSYAPDETEPVVQNLMQGQHKAVLKQLRNGVFDPRLREYFHSRGEPFEEAPAPPILPLSSPPRESSLIRQLNLQRLDAPGASIATTEPYSPVMSEFERMNTRPRGIAPVMDADLIELAGLAANAEEAAERLDPGAGQVLELEAEPEGEDELRFDPPRPPQPPPREYRVVETVLPVPMTNPPRRPDQEKPRSHPFFRPVTGKIASGKPPSERTPSAMLRSSSRSPRRGTGEAPGRVVVVPSSPTESVPRPVATQQADPGDLPAEPTRVRLLPMPVMRTHDAVPSAPFRPEASPSPPRPTAEGVVIQRPVFVSDKNSRGEAKPNQPVTAPRIEKDPKAPLPLDERSLDQVILAYLAEDLNNKK